MRNLFIDRTVAACNQNHPQWNVPHVCYRSQAQANAILQDLTESSTQT